jgi:hypothetical protein
MGKIMAKNKPSSHLQAFLQTIKDEWKGLYRKFPDLTIFALRDDDVVAAIEKRFAEKASIKTVRQLDYDFYTGLHNLVFDFAPTLSDLGTRASDAFLVIIDSKGKVIAVIDPFDPVQPNVFVPPLPAESEQPFVLDRPSAAAEVTFSDQQLYPIRVRSRAFFQRLRIGGIGIAPGDPEIYTKCSYTTWTPVGYVADWNTDDCGLPSDILI